jgi:hypothetical protein
VALAVGEHESERAHLPACGSTRPKGQSDPQLRQASGLGSGRG